MGTTRQHSTAHTTNLHDDNPVPANTTAQLVRLRPQVNCSNLLESSFVSRLLSPTAGPAWPIVISPGLATGSTQSFRCSLSIRRKRRTDPSAPCTSIIEVLDPGFAYRTRARNVRLPSRITITPLFQEIRGLKKFVFSQQSTPHFICCALELYNPRHLDS